MNKKYTVLLILLGMVQLNIAMDQRNLRELTSEQLRSLNKKATENLALDEYKLLEDTLQFKKCLSRNPNLPERCDSLKKRYRELLDDTTALDKFNRVNNELHYRNEHEGFSGEKSLSEVIGRDKFNNKVADQYRRGKNLSSKTKDELIDKQKKTKEKIDAINEVSRNNRSAYQGQYSHNAFFKLLAIERELKSLENLQKTK